MPLSDLKVLIVEDDPIISGHLSQLLSVNGAKVVGKAYNGLRALDLLHNCSPQFVICDVHLGNGMTGIDVAEVIHQKYNLPYIFLTSFDDESTLAQAQEHSPYGYLVKPFQDRTLISTIKVALSNHQKKSSSGRLVQSDIENKIKDSLSEREFVILQSLIAGYTYQQIADTQHLSKDTIKYHAGKLYNKCQVKNRSELAGRFL